MQWARYDRVMIAWDGQLGPTFRADDSRPYHHFVVSRGLMGNGSDARVVGKTEAEAYIDNAVQPSRVYHYSVQGADDAAETTLTAVGPKFTVATPHSPPVDRIPPTVPGGLAAGAAETPAVAGTWAETQPVGDINQYWNTCAVSADGSVLLAGSYTGGSLYLSTNGGSSWADARPDGVSGDWLTCAVSADGLVLLAGAFPGRLWLSTNGGTSWAETQPIRKDASWRSCAVSADGLVLLAGVSGGRLYLSTNGGSSWAETQPAGNVDTWWYSCACDSDGSVLLAGVSTGRLYLSTNGGSSWAEMQPAGDVSKGWIACACDSDGSVLLAGVEWGLLYLSTNGGSSWAETSGNINQYWHTCAVSADGSVLLAGSYTGGHVYLSTNGGSSWAETYPPALGYKEWYCCAVNADGSVLLAGVVGGRLFLYGGGVAPGPGGGGWTWTPSSKADPTRLLAYLVYDSNQSQPKAVVWARDAAGDPVTSWPDPTTGPRSYRMAAIDKDLNISAPSNIATAA